MNQINNSKKLIVHRTPLVWNKKPLLSKQNDSESQSGCSYLLTDENVNSENHQKNGQNIQSSQIKKTATKKKKMKNKFSISNTKDYKFGSFINDNNFSKENSAKRDVFISLFNYYDLAFSQIKH